MALMMYRNRPSRFGAEWKATDPQYARWSELIDRAVERDSAVALRLSNLR